MMPSPMQTKNCAHCGNEWNTRSKTARTCSPKCRAQLREKERGPTKGRAPREYPAELVEKIRSQYESGATIKEIQADTKGIKVQNVIRRYGIKTRNTAKRDQWGENNSSWKGDHAKYAALHLRVEAARGKPQQCEVCAVATPGRYEWANLTGQYTDIYDYQRMCVSCHRQYDAARRRATGMRTSPNRR